MNHWNRRIALAAVLAAFSAPALAADPARDCTVCSDPTWPNLDNLMPGIGLNGPYELAADTAVHGINHYEASACAAWAGARLPHEYQWEAAHRSRQLDDVGRAWEWCANSFHPYNGFSAFPYEGYSTPWFDGTHYSLRGASLHTRPELRRASFRNFYTAEKRHIFAGLRLVY